MYVCFLFIAHDFTDVNLPLISRDEPNPRSGPGNAGLSGRTGGPVPVRSGRISGKNVPDQKFFRSVFRALNVCNCALTPPWPYIS